MKPGPILLIEDDVDDQEFIIDALQTLGIQNEVLTFDSGKKALDFLRIATQQPFMIISDVNLPVMNGLQLKYEIQKDEYLRSKSIPFIFLSTSADPKAVKEAFDLSVQGFFVKPDSMSELKETIDLIMKYWKRCVSPNCKSSA